ncbi:MAG: SWIM zinc finger domain-containing protein [Blastocatellia bacterium]
MVWTLAEVVWTGVEIAWARAKVIWVGAEIASAPANAGFAPAESGARRQNTISEDAMAKGKLPRLTEAMVRALANDKSFERGKDYYRGGAISETMRQGLELRGECAGSEYEPYEISVTFNAKGIADTSCTCPYEYGGICKHTVALLLTYVHQPQAFHAAASVEGMLKQRSKEELLAIIDAMLRRDPKLRSLVELAATAQDASAGKAVDIAAIRKSARRALQHNDWDHSSARKIAKELRALGQIAESFVKANDWLAAGRVCHALLDETVSGYDHIIQQVDENGHIAVVVEEFTEVLGKALAKSNADSPMRRAWLETLLDAFAKDIEIGGIDFAFSARGIILKQASDEEWQGIEARVRRLAAGSRDWSREQLVRFLTEGLAKRGRKSEGDRLIREIGTPEQQAKLLIKEGHIEEAVRLMNDLVEGKPGLVTQFADWLLEAKAKQAALNFVLAHERTASWRRDQWLADYYRRHGTSEEAVAAQKTMLINSPSVEQFKALQAVCGKTKNWPEVRAEALAALERAGRFDALVEIALHEGDVARALEGLARATGGGATHLRMKVAAAAEKDLPHEAVRLYLERAEQEIAGRSRGSYSVAASTLKKVRPLFIQLHNQAAWAEYIQSLRESHKNLRALQDELRKAGL